MSSSDQKRSPVPAAIFLLTLVFLLLAGDFAESKGMDCERHCRMHRVSVGSCRCRSELFVKRNMPSENSDGGRDYLLRELIKDYFLQNEETDDK